MYSGCLALKYGLSLVATSYPSGRLVECLLLGYTAVNDLPSFSFRFMFLWAADGTPISGESRFCAAGRGLYVLTSVDVYTFPERFQRNPCI